MGLPIYLSGSTVYLYDYIRSVEVCAYGSLQIQISHLGRLLRTPGTIRKHSKLSALSQLLMCGQVTVNCGLTLAAVVDLMVTTILTYYLRQHKSRFRKYGIRVPLLFPDHTLNYR